MKKTINVALGAIALAIGLSSQAAVIYDNGSPNLANGNQMTNWIQAEDFTLSVAGTFDTIRFWNLGASLGGTFNWQIYSSVAGAPGAVLFSGNVLATQTATGASAYGLAEYREDLDVGSIALSSGSYFLGLHNGPLSDTTSNTVYWETTAANGTPSGMENAESFADNSFNSNGQEHAFQLLGGTVAAAAVVPEPDIAATFGLGLVGLVAVRRRRRA